MCARSHTIRLDHGNRWPRRHSEAPLSPAPPFVLEQVGVREDGRAMVVRLGHKAKQELGAPLQGLQYVDRGHFAGYMWTSVHLAAGGKVAGSAVCPMVQAIGFSQQYRRHRVFSRRRDITLKFSEKTNVEESRLYSFFFPLLVFVLAFFCLLSSFSRTSIWQKGRGNRALPEAAPGAF